MLNPSQFIIQADFSLTSSREEIDHTSKWNQTLRESISPLFKAAVDKMNELPPYRFVWMRYLPTLDLPNSFLSKPKNTIKDYLKDAPCLWSQNQQRLHEPKELIYVPAKFRSRDKKPLFYQMAGRRALSFNYQEQDIPTIIDLGVIRLDIDIFIERIEHVVNQNWSRFTQYTLDWHEDLAKTLLKADSEMLLALPLIPLEVPEGAEEEWISAKDLMTRNVFLKPEVENTQIPPGIDLDFVETTAMRSPARLALIRKLGVNSCDETAICSAIVRLLNRPKMPVLDDAVAQTKYLFEHRSEFTTSNINFWSTRAKTTDPIATGGKKIYFDDYRQTYPVSTLLPLSINAFHLHPRYLESPYADLGTEWLDWLIECQLATVPRMASKGLTKFSRNPSPDFSAFLDNSDQACIIEVLLQNWNFYEPGFGLISSHIKPKLDGIILPLPKLLRIAQKYGLKATDKRFLQMKIEEEEVIRYEKLECFGVCTKASGTFYLELLRHLKKQLEMPEVELVHSVYRKLQQSSDLNEIKLAICSHVKFHFC